MDEERAIYIGLIAISLPTLLIEVYRAARFGVIDTLALIALFASVIGLVRSFRSQIELPRARARTSLRS